MNVCSPSLLPPSPSEDSCDGGTWYSISPLSTSDGLRLLPTELPAHNYTSTAYDFLCCCTSQLAQEHAYPLCFRPFPSENPDDGRTVFFPAESAMGCICFPPNSACASRSRRVFVPSSSSRARSSTIIAHEAGSVPTISRVFISPRRSAQAAMRSTSIKSWFSCLTLSISYQGNDKAE